MSIFRTIKDALRAQLWPLPTVALLLSIAAGVSVPRLDGRIDGSVPGGLSWLLFGGDAGAARTVFDAISSSMITVTSLTFSLTVVTLQLASSQFSPRLLRTFTSDLFVQLTLALFLGTFTYSLIALRSVRSAGDTQVEFVPRIAVTLSFVFAVASVLTLVLFLAHLTRQIRVETMLHNVRRASTRSIEEVLAEPDPELVAEIEQLLEPHPGQLPILGEREGFLTWVEQQDLVELACEASALVVVTAEPGAFLVRGTPVGHVRPLGGATLRPDDAGQLCAQVARQIHTGTERTGTQDVAFGLRQLTDVANKALSPGINDPTTAIHALGHISALLCDLADHQLGPGLVRDADGEPRLVLTRPDLAGLVELAIGQPRRYGAGDHQVVRRLYLLLGELAIRVAPEHYQVVTSQLGRLRASIAKQDFDDAERSDFADLGRDVENILSADAAPQRGP